MYDHRLTRLLVNSDNILPKLLSSPNDSLNYSFTNKRKVLDVLCLQPITSISRIIIIINPFLSKLSSVLTDRNLQTE